MQKPCSIALSKPGVKSDDDIVIVAAVRTAITNARKGGFAETPVEELLAAVFKEAISRAKIDPALIDDIVVGSVLGQNVQRANEARIAQFLAGIPYTTSLQTCNRQCASGAQAIAHVAASIHAGFYDIGLAAGVESMSTAKMGWDGEMNPKIFLNPLAKDCLLPMGITSENVATKYGIGRVEQDTLAALSNNRAVKAIEEGKFKDEIVPVTVTKTDPKTGQKVKKVVDTDEGPKPSTVESLGKLKPAFGGHSTGGNSSKVSDGAAATLLMKRRTAVTLGCEILGVFHGYVVAGCEPSLMGTGPVYAIPKLFEKAGITDKDVDLYDINEAFGSIPIVAMKKLNIDIEKVNINGGAIALGHPLGVTGNRVVATLLYRT
eukprot:UN01421